MPVPDNELGAKLEALIVDASSLSTKIETNKAEALRTRGKKIAVRRFGVASTYVQRLDDLNFPTGQNRGYYSSDFTLWDQNTRELVVILSAMQDEFEAPDKQGEGSKMETPDKTKSKEIFIVHGQDEGMKQHVARVIDALGLEPVILHERPSMGRTIIEKFDANADVNFAIILLSPDDLAYPKIANPKSAKARARQNVVFEFGYFVGKLNRQNVLPLFRNEGNFEMPTDLLGVVYVTYDSGGGWKATLVRELKQAGYDVDANKVLHL
jgi:predicted nucleotide-binding protein